MKVTMTAWRQRSESVIRKHREKAAAMNRGKKAPYFEKEVAAYGS